MNAEIHDLVLQCLYFHKGLSKSHKRINTVLFDLHQANFYNSQDNIGMKEIKPSVAYLAKKAKCAKRTVERYNTKVNFLYSKLVDIKRTRKSGYDHLNTYRFSKYLFASMFLLKFCGGLYDKKIVHNLLMQVSEDERFIEKFLTRVFQKCRQVNVKNDGALNYTLNYILEIVLNEKGTSLKTPLKEDSNTITLNFGKAKLSYEDKKTLIYKYTIPDIEKALDDYKFYSNSGNKVLYPKAYIVSRINSYHSYRSRERI